MNRSETLTKIAPALVKALGQIEGAAKSANNPHFRKNYADLTSVIDASKTILHSHGITLIQLPGPVVDGNLTLETILLHESGEFIGGEGALPIGKQDPQGAGSALTYLRRYSQMAALNMPAVDDDGEAAHGRGGPSQARQEPARNGAQEAVREGLKASVEALEAMRARLWPWATDIDRDWNGQRMTPAELKRRSEDAKIGKYIATLDLAGVAAFTENFTLWTRYLPPSWLDGVRDDLERHKQNLLAGPPRGEADMDAEFRAVVGRPDPAPVSRSGRHVEGVA